MEELCIQCANIVRPRQEAIECDRCSLWQHRTCDTGITRAAYREAVKSKTPIAWICLPCGLPAAPVIDIVDDALFRPDESDQVHTPVDENASFRPEESFEAPNNADESDQVFDETVNDSVTITDYRPEYEVVDTGSIRGKRKLVDNRGYTYTVKKTKSDSGTLWRCSIRNKTVHCNATVIQNGNDFVIGKNDHVHPAKPGILIATKMTARSKAEACDDVFTVSAPKLVERIIAEDGDLVAPEHSRPKPANLVRAVNRLRLQSRPQDPKDMDFILDIDYIDRNMPNFFAREITVDNKRHLVFYTDRQLKLLAGAKTWYLDGTFRVVKPPFTQLFTIHAFVRCGDDIKQIPLMYCLMSGKRKADYYEVLRRMDRALPNEISLQCFVVDFEAGIWQAIKDRFPGYHIQGCVFHWTQAIFRKVQEKGLQTAYNSKGAVYEFIRKVMALPFLPAEHILSTFRHLQQKASPELETIMDYVESTWMVNSVFRIPNWSIFMKSIRTNNDCEGWHNRLNQYVNQRGPVPFYLLISHLYKEAQKIPMDVLLLKEHKLLRLQRKRTKQTEGQLMALWSAYSAGEISATGLLRKCAAIYGPAAN